MIKVLEGQITFGGMHDALEAVGRHKNVKLGVLRVTSNSCSGLIGIFCGRFITGAVMTLTGETGYPALRTLLLAKDGTFALMDATDEPVPEINQSLGVDLQSLLSSVDFSIEQIPISEESLTSMSAAPEQVRLIDTSLEMEAFAEELTADRINRTYDRILSLSEYRRANDGEQLLNQEPNLSEVRSETDFGDDDFSRKRSTPPVVPSDSLRSSEPSPAPVMMVNSVEDAEGDYAISYDPNRSSDPRPGTAEFKRLKDWSHKSQMYTKLAWAGIFVSIIVLIVIYGPNLATMIGSIIAK